MFFLRIFLRNCRIPLSLSLICLCWPSCADQDTQPTHSADGSEKRQKPRWIVSDRVVKAERISVFLRGSSTSNEITQVLKELHDVKKPASRYIARRLDKNPSQSLDFIEAICKQNVASMFGFGSSTKRRRNHLLLGRLYNGKILDMFEFQAHSETTSKKLSADVSSDSRPCFVFLGECWTNDNTLNEFKNFLIDCFGVRHDKHVSLQSLGRVIVCSAFNSTRVELRHFANRLQVRLYLSACIPSRAHDGAAGMRHAHFAEMCTDPTCLFVQLGYTVPRAAERAPPAAGGGWRAGPTRAAGHRPGAPVGRAWRPAGGYGGDAGRARAAGAGLRRAGRPREAAAAVRRRRGPRARRRAGG